MSDVQDFTLNPIAKKLWIDALRDPKRSQTTGCLYDQSGMCCLGVAADISGLGEWSGPYKRQMYVTADGVNREESVTPVEVAEWLGFPRISDTTITPLVGTVIQNPFIPGLTGRDVDDDGTGYTLASLNDAGLTFPQIADVIEYFL